MSTHTMPREAVARLAKIRAQARRKCLASMFLITCSVALAADDLQAETSDVLRLSLTAQPPSSQLQQAVERYQTADRSARFTWLRGHIDAFSAQPKPMVPAYAREILEQAGLPIGPVEQPGVETSPLPKDAEGEGAISAEADAGKDVGFPGLDDPEQEPADNAPVEADGHGEPDVWYKQSGGNLVKPILRQFLTANNDVFELGPQLLANNLPNLRLVHYGVGKHFRRAVFTQTIGNRPVLDGKTIVLFDMNWNIVGISRQLLTQQKLGFEPTPTIPEPQARHLAVQALKLTQPEVRILGSQLGVDVLRQILAWQVQVLHQQEGSEFTVTLHGNDGTLLNISDDSARYNDAQLKRWDYSDGNMTQANRVITTGVYTHDDNTLVHDFFYLVNDDRNDGGTGACTATSPSSDSTPNAYGTTSSSEYIRPTRRSDRNFTLWDPQAPKGSFGESHVYYWARKYMQWQKQALIDLGVLTTGNFNNYTKILIIANACDARSGHYTCGLNVSTMDNLGENLCKIVLPERCRAGNANCTPADFADSNSGNLYTYEGSGGYHFPGVIHHELNHFVLIDYFNVKNGLDCSISKELRYFQEGGLGRTLPQMYWHNHYGVGYLPDTTDKLFRSNGTSGEVHDERDASSLNHLSNFACADGTNDPYSWGSVVSQPMWEIYHGQKVEGATRVNMARPARDLGMIKSMYYAADLASASTFQDRFELANRFMEFWELFSTAVSTTKADWCEVWGHHGMDTWINASYCN